MNFTKYIESCDIAEHIRKIGYTPTAPEIAFAIYQNLKRKQHARFYEPDGAVYFASFYRRDESGDTERRDDTSVCFSDSF